MVQGLSFHLAAHSLIVFLPVTQFTLDIVTPVATKSIAFKNNKCMTASLVRLVRNGEGMLTNMALLLDVMTTCFKIVVVVAQL